MKSSNKFRHLIWPLVSLALLLIFNAFFTKNFFKIEIKKPDLPAVAPMERLAEQTVLAAVAQDGELKAFFGDFLEKIAPAIESAQKADDATAAETAAEQAVSAAKSELAAARKGVKRADDRNNADKKVLTVEEAEALLKDAEQKFEQASNAAQLARKDAVEPTAAAGQAAKAASAKAVEAFKVAKQAAKDAQKAAKKAATEQAAAAAKAAKVNAEKAEQLAKTAKLVAMRSEQAAKTAKENTKGVSIFGYYLYGTPIDILNQGAKVMVLAIGMTLVIATGGIDISVGAVMAIAGAIAALLISLLDKGSIIGSSMGPAWYWIIPVVAALILATVAGFWNGMLVAGFGIQPMVATLVLMVAGRGVAQLITDGQIITFDNPGLVFLCNGHALFLPFSVWIVVTMYAAAGLMTRKTAFGLFVESVGNNERASRYAGIEARRIKWLAYVICGFCAGVAGLLAASNIKCADSNNAGLYLELDAILATVIGGTSMAGGRFFLSGSLVGAILIQTLTTTMYMKNVSPAIVAVPKAMVVIIVCLLQSPVFRAKVLSLFASKAAKGGVQ